MERADALRLWKAIVFTSMYQELGRRPFVDIVRRAVPIASGDQGAGGDEMHITHFSESVLLLLSQGLGQSFSGLDGGKGSRLTCHPIHG